MIEHLVISGGGTIGFIQFGVLYKLYNEGYWDPKHIRSIYGTSCGSIIGASLLLGIDMETLHDYIIHRPWEKVLPTSMNSFLDLFNEKGLLNGSIIQCIMEYLLKYKGFTIDMTLKDLHDHSKREFYLYAVDAFTLKTLEISHHTHPDLPVLKAIHMSSSVPFCIQPVWYDGTYYIDGGININYPLQPCLERNEYEERILSIRTQFWGETKLKQFTQETGFVDYYAHILTMFMRKSYPSDEKRKIKNEVIIPYKGSDSSNIEAMYSKKVRDEWVEYGKKYAILFLEYQKE